MVVLPFKLVELPPVARVDVTKKFFDVTLSGAGSSDADGDTLTSYTWSQPEGQNIDLSYSGTDATFTAPPSLGTYIFTLTVSDGRLSDSTEVAVVFDDENLLLPPNAEAYSSQSDFDVHLYGNRSTDPSGLEKDFIYQWSQPSRQDAELSLQTENGDHAVFDIDSASEAGLYTFTLTVHKGHLTDIDVVKINAIFPNLMTPSTGSGRVTEDSISFSWIPYSRDTTYNIDRECQYCGDPGKSFLGKYASLNDTGLRPGTTYEYSFEAKHVSPATGKVRSQEGTKPFVFTTKYGTAELAPGLNVDVGDYVAFTRGHNGSIYALSSKRYQHWSSARDFAEDAGGQLATIDSQEDNELIVSQLLGDGWNENVWLGASDADYQIGIDDAHETSYKDSKSGWYWVDGDNLSLDPHTGGWGWDLYQPSGARGNDCLVMQADGQWADHGCSSSRYALIEFAVASDDFLSKGGFRDIIRHDDGTFYALTAMNTYNWSEARDEAQDQGGDLASLKNSDEAHRAYALFKDLNFNLKIWAGATDDPALIKGAYESSLNSHFSFPTEGWRWTNGESFLRYDGGDWHVNSRGTQKEPNNSVSGGEGENCLEVYFKHSSDHIRWNDQQCSDKRYGIMTFPAFPLMR